MPMLLRFSKGRDDANIPATARPSRAEHDRMSPRASSYSPVTKRHPHPVASDVKAYRRSCCSRAQLQQAGPTNERVVVVVCVCAGRWASLSEARVVRIDRQQRPQEKQGSELV